MTQKAQQARRDSSIGVQSIQATEDTTGEYVTGVRFRLRLSVYTSGVYPLSFGLNLSLCDL